MDIKISMNIKNISGYKNISEYLNKIPFQPISNRASLFYSSGN